MVKIKDNVFNRMNRMKVYILANKYFVEDLKNIMGDIESLEIVDNIVNHDITKEDKTLFLYGADSPADKNYNGRTPLDSLAKERRIIPILKDLNKFQEYVPTALEGINGLKVASDKDIVKLKNRILELFGIIESNKKVFISYKRSDSEMLANQLYVALIKEGYAPFLDLYSLDAGVQFQEYLLHELSDSSIFVFINSRNYSMSKFTMKELQTCDFLQMGMIEVRSKDANTYQEAAFAAKYNLPDIETEEYPPNVIREIIDEIESYRAKMFELRRKKFIDELNFRQICIDENLEEGMMYDEKNEVLYFPIYHIPTSMDLYKIDQRESDVSGKAIALFDGICCRNDVKKHIEWLNASLPIKAQDINEMVI